MSLKKELSRTCVRIFLVCIIPIQAVFSQYKNLSPHKMDSILWGAWLGSMSEPEEAFKVSEEVYRLAKQQHDYRRQSMALLDMAKAKGDYGHHDEALRYLGLAERLAQNTNTDSLLLFADFIRAVQYGRIRQNEKAVALLEDCFGRIDCLEGDSRYIMLGRLYSFKAFFSGGLKHKPTNEEFLYLHRMAAKYYGKTKVVPNTGLANIGEYYLSSGELDSAQYYLEAALETYRACNYHFSQEILMSNLAEVYIQNGRYEEAAKYLDTSIHIAQRQKKYYLLVSDYGKYKQLFLRQGQTEKAFNYQELEVQYRDSAEMAEVESMISGNTYVIEQNEKKQARLRSWGMFLGIGAIVLVVALLVYAVRQYRIRKRIAIENQKKEQRILQKRAQIVTLKQQISSSYEEVIQLARSNDQRLVPAVKELYPGFFEKLYEIQPDITFTEQKVCFFLKLKFSTKEIADHTFVSVKAIQNRKNRLRKRLHLGEGEDLYSWIDQL